MSVILRELDQPEKTSGVCDLDSVSIVHARKQHDFINKQRQKVVIPSCQHEDEFSELCSDFIQYDDLVVTHGSRQQKFSIRKRYA